MAAAARGPVAAVATPPAARPDARLARRYPAAMPPRFDVHHQRQCFPGLLRRHGDDVAVFFDGPAGSQLPRRVVEAMSHYALYENANHGGPFVTSRRTDAMVASARAAAADFFTADDAEEVVFGANMTTLTFHVARALARTWRRGDRIVVTDSDHDANIAPWRRAARDAGCELARIPVRPDSTLDLDGAARTIDGRTRLVAIGAASNLSGTIHPVAQVAALAKARGALTYVDAVHLAPHARLDVRQLGADFAVCSAYKFFGPHLGLLWGRRELLEGLDVDKVQPAPDHGAEKWQTGTANFAAIAGTAAAIDYLVQLGGGGERRPALDRAFAAIGAHETAATEHLLRGLEALPGVRLVGLARDRLAERCPTVSFVAAARSPQQLATALAERQVFCWPGHSYAVALSTALGLEPHGALRLGLLHYNTTAEIDHVLALLRALLS